MGFFSFVLAFIAAAIAGSIIFALVYGTWLASEDEPMIFRVLITGGVLLIILYLLWSGTWGSNE